MMTRKRRGSVAVALAGALVAAIGSCTTADDGAGSETHVLCKSDEDCEREVGPGSMCIEERCTEADPKAMGSDAGPDPTDGAGGSAGAGGTFDDGGAAGAGGGDAGAAAAGGGTVSIASCDAVPHCAVKITHDANGNETSVQLEGDCFHRDCFPAAPQQPSSLDDYCGCRAWTYDANGNRTSEQVDGDCDGTPEVCRTWTYDANENRTTEQNDEGCNGTPEVCRTWTYDANGSQTSERSDGNCDGTPDGYCITWTYDASGNRTGEQLDGSLHEAPGCDGTADECKMWTYDASGNRTSEHYDGDCDGTPDGDCIRWTYDANGNLMSEQSDDIGSCDGTPDACTAWTYDANGNLTGSGPDGDCDGTPEAYTSEYDAFGNLTRAMEIFSSLGGVGAVCHARTYDSNGNVTSEQSDMLCDGTLDRCTTWTYEGGGPGSGGADGGA